MRRTAACVVCLALWIAPGFAAASEIAAIAYHDIVLDRNGDPYAITLAEFERQMQYLRRSGYNPISLRTLDEARTGRIALPAKPVLLTFDDGLKSYARHAYPVLRRYGYPSIISIVTSWVDGRRPHGPGTNVMTWDELRELARSPDVEVLSHTDDLHRGLPANPSGSDLPAAVTRIYDGKYETEAAHARRVRGDLARSVERLHAELGRPPFGIAWPYGEYDATLVEAAAELGMGYHLTLGIEPTRLTDLPRINRTALKYYRSLSDFADALTHKAYRRRQLRFAEIDLGIFRGLDPAAHEPLLSRLLARLETLRVNAVLITPFTADGTRAFFYNGVVPVEADLLSRVTQQLLRRTHTAHVYLRVPVSNPALYTDLARLNWFNGVVLDAAGTAEQFEAARAIFTRHRPMLRIGIANDTAVRGADFHLMALPADAAAKTLTERAAAALRADANTVIMLRRSSATSEATLRAAMQALRAAGTAHYGYGPDDVLNNTPSVLGIVGALHEHTAVAVPK